MGLPEGQVIEQAYVILLKLDKNKEVLVSNDWGKMGRKLEELYWQQVALEHDTFTPHPSWVGLFHSPVTSPWSHHTIHILG